METVANLSRTGLSALPPELLARTDLETLILYHNHITDLPAEVGKLHRLRKLDLAGNSLTGLPAEIGELKLLRELDLGGNLLTTLPPQIGELPGLQLLDLRDNQLTMLPTSLAPLLAKGQLTVRLDGNPLDEALAQTLGRGTRALGAYLQSLEDGVPQFEAKILLVGEGNVGKTSLVGALNNEQFVKGRPTTHGIEIRELRLPHPWKDEVLTLRTWDFGGQEIYRVTHQFFFSRRAVYLLVWHPREGQEQGEVEGWLRRIRLRVGADARVVVVATHGDERRPELDYPRLRDAFPTMLAGQHTVDSETANGIPALRQAIAAEAARLPQMGQLTSRRWADARDAILTRAAAEPQIPFDDFAVICRQHRVRDEEIHHLAELLHDLGQVIYYGDDDGLRDIVILNPEWLTKAISHVLEDQAVRHGNGILDHRELRRIWRRRDDGLSYDRTHHPFFLRLMEKFDVSYRLEDGERSLIAQLVPFERPVLPWGASTPVPDGLRVLRLTCELDESAPPGLVAWLTVRHHDASTGRHWRRGVFLRHPIDAYRSEALVELHTDQALTVEVRAPSPDLFFNVLRDSLERLLTTRWPGLAFRLFVPCPTGDADGVGCAGRFPLDGLIKFRERSAAPAPVREATAVRAGEPERDPMQRLSLPCLTCQHDHDVTGLLTGFVPPTLLGDELNRLERRMGTLTREVGQIGGHLADAASFAADSAHHLRQVVKAVGTEVTDCPRLFTVATLPPTGWRWFWFTRRPIRITLWCEHPGQWHTWDGASYQLDQPRQWLRASAPYLNLMFKTLRLVHPVATSMAAFVAPDLSGVQRELNLMKALIDTLPTAVVDDAAPVGTDARHTLSPAEGAALRSFRVLLSQLDPAQTFGGLSRVFTPAGEFLWVCPRHRPLHDPGLPVLP
ncbi:COR domain-containing protein [Micromonospora peucetia]|uniref:non-specific serine/threonine protein kinase n=1 Tax=Micromonospora peucetia TaxID=47871 RepID=A0A1C6VY76_9ACTN|nr:COR domain-containing protein [Micromonospora peucetia]SCL71273.1 Leucine rich repeat-containing protein [Micromonospora peucetia]